jgi:hypothetical protein
MHFTRDDDALCEFVTPYALKVNQKTGLFEKVDHYAQDQKLRIIASNPITALEIFIAKRNEEHVNSFKEAESSALGKDFGLWWKETKQASKSMFGYTAGLEVDAAKQLIRIINGENVTLSKDEESALKQGRLKTIINTHNINVNQLNEANKNNVIDMNNNK